MDGYMVADFVPDIVVSVGGIVLVISAVEKRYAVGSAVGLNMEGASVG